MNKKILAAAIVGGLFAGSAHAQVNLSATTANPVLIAQEANIGADGLTVLNPGGALTLQTNTNYAFSDGEVRYARIQCSPNMVFPAAAASAVTLTGASVGNLNGVGTNAINFSITANGAVPSTAVLSVAGPRIFTSREAVSCEYSLYDQPSQAASGGETGRIAIQQGAYAAFAASYGYNNTVFNSVASVEADPSFSDFLTNTTGTTANTARLGQILFNTRENVLTDADQPIGAAGTAVTLATILGTTTRHVVNGDFSAAANANGTFTGEALTRVFVATGTTTCAAATGATRVNATAVTATSATFATGNGVVAGGLCYTPRDGVAIPASDYSISLAPVSNDGYTASPAGPSAVGSITRDGTELQAPFVQVPAGWLARIAISNTGTSDRPYSLSVLSANADGSTTVEAFDLAADVKTGMIPAGTTRVIRLDDASLAAAARRGTVIVNVAGPSNTVQGLYQVVNPNTGLVTNHVMVRPDTN
ncbi:hypothetical protein [Luteimonas sp. 3794]|uniref:hypothetical protein n=1 Tax=Luteimonas sp. 3794 TaxID=2817730 RepID=UPI00286B5372|nr:hypothetical protein [Luteimonas sp. 3794]